MGSFFVYLHRSRRYYGTEASSQFGAEMFSQALLVIAWAQRQRRALTMPSAFVFSARRNNVKRRKLQEYVFNSRK